MLNEGATAMPQAISKPAVGRVRRTMTYNQLTSCPDMEPAFERLYELYRPFTMTSLERMYALYKAIEHAVARGIDGDVVECGVWKGGTAMLMASALADFGQTDRLIYLYDTYEGMVDPTGEDVDYDDVTPRQRLNRLNMTSFGEWCCAPLDEVRSNMARTAYPIDRFVFVKGRVEQTIPRVLPEAICLLHLDTDWYASTRHELRHLYPLLGHGGALSIDDYGHWRGCRRAVDEYFQENNVNMFLSRTDYTGRIGVKP